MIYGAVRSLLFRMDAEGAHEFAFTQLERAQKSALLLRLIRGKYRRNTSEISKTLWGLTFPNPVGIAAGFDKNGRLIPALEALGFGFVEVGTVTLYEQEGNPKPRLFRFPKHRALINRLGFNNEGAEAVAKRLEETAASHPSRVPLFVNIGKNRDVTTSGAVRAYRECYRIVAPYADGVVVNVSSPNTPGLRDLQQAGHLSEILKALNEERSLARFTRSGDHPIIVKISPDLTADGLAELAAVCASDADGIIAANTTIDETALPGGSPEVGGISGRPLFVRSTEVLRRLRQLVGPGFPLIGTGGIFSGEDAWAKMEAGADLVQAYTGFVYVGPSFAHRIASYLTRQKSTPPTN